MNSDLIELISTFNQFGIRYMIAGGHAVMYYCEPRYTKDLDIAVASTAEDVAKLKNALAQFGFAIPDSVIEEFREPNKMLVFGFAPNRVDILNQLKGIDFEEAYSRRIDVDFEGIKISMISLTDLIATKTATGRPQDLLDLKQLVAKSAEPIGDRKYP